MPISQIADVIVPSEFSEYTVENSLLSTAFFESGVLVPNPLIKSQLAAGSNNFNIPFWGEDENDPDITSDVPTQLSTPLKITASKQVVRKSFLHQSWSEMNLASELAGSDALQRVQSRVLAYWNRTHERRLIASLMGVLYGNVANNSADMVNDISGNTGTAGTTTSPYFNGDSVIDTALTLGDRLSDVKSIAMHSKIYGEALKNDEIQFFKPSDNAIEIPTYKGMSVIIDDNLTTTNAGVYVTILFGPGAVGFGVSEPNSGYGTEIFRYPSSGNGGGQTELHSRVNVALHPLGMSFVGASVAGESPTAVELALPANWTRAVSQRKRHANRKINSTLLNSVMQYAAADSQLCAQAISIYMHRVQDNGFVRFDSLQDAPAAKTYFEFLVAIGILKKDINLVSRRSLGEITISCTVGKVAIEPSITNRKAFI